MVSKVILPQQFFSCSSSVVWQAHLHCWLRIACQLEWLKCLHRSPFALPAAHSTFSQAWQVELGQVLSSSRICQSPWANHSAYLYCCELGWWTLYSCIPKSHFILCLWCPLFIWWCHRIIVTLYLVLAFRVLAWAFFRSLALTESKQASKSIT